MKQKLVFEEQVKFVVNFFGLFSRNWFQGITYVWAWKWMTNLRCTYEKLTSQTHSECTVDQTWFDVRILNEKRLINELETGYSFFLLMSSSSAWLMERESSEKRMLDVDWMNECMMKFASEFFYSTSLIYFFDLQVAFLYKGSQYQLFCPIWQSFINIYIYICIFKIIII